MQSATGNDVGPKNGRAANFNDQVPRLERWLEAHPDAEYFPPCQHDSNFRVRWGEVEFKALHLGLLLDKLEQLGQ